MPATRSHSASNPSHLHAVGDSVRQRGDDISSSAPSVAMPDGSLGSLGAGTAAHLNTHLQGLHQQTQTMGAHVTQTGDTLHANANAIEANEEHLADSFGTIGSAGPLAQGVGGRTEPASTTAGSSSGGGPVRTGGGKHRFNPMAGRPSRPGGGGPSGSGEGEGDGAGGNSPTPPPPPPPTLGTPGVRPPNFDPNISPDVHTHVSHGDWSNGSVHGGHVHESDVTTSADGQSNGTVGFGAAPPYGTPAVRPQANGVYTNPNPWVQFGGEYGYQQKPSGGHTMFPPGVSDTDVHTMGSQAWNNPQATFWDRGNGTGGDWSGQTTIPPGYPNSGTPIKINGRWNDDGTAATYFPSPNQPGGPAT